MEQELLFDQQKIRNDTISCEGRTFALFFWCMPHSGFLLLGNRKSQKRSVKIDIWLLQVGLGNI